jgi:hypothetical protein
LQISHQHQLTIPLTTPTDALTIGKGDGTIHRLEIIGESLQIPSRQGAQAEITKSGIEKVELAQNRWQDGEMGHGCHGGLARR